MIGHDITKPRLLSEKVDIEAIEKKFGVKIPSQYKMFLESFMWREEAVKGKHFYYYPDLSCGELTFPYPDIEDNIRASLGSSDDEILGQKLIVLASSRYGFYVGTVGDSTDKVLAKTNSSEGFKVVANNVFEFLRGVTNNLSDVAESEEEYRRFMIQLGYEDDDLEQQIIDWKTYKSSEK